MKLFLLFPLFTIATIACSCKNDSKSSGTNLPEAPPKDTVVKTDTISKFHATDSIVADTVLVIVNLIKSELGNTPTLNSKHARNLRSDERAAIGFVLEFSAGTKGSNCDAFSFDEVEGLLAALGYGKDPNSFAEAIQYLNFIKTSFATDKKAQKIIRKSENREDTYEKCSGIILDLRVRRQAAKFTLALKAHGTRSVSDITFKQDTKPGIDSLGRMTVPIIADFNSYSWSWTEEFTFARDGDGLKLLSDIVTKTESPQNIP